MAEVFDYRGARERVFAAQLPPTLKVVMLSLVEHMPNCRPSIPRLAAMCCVERKTVMRALSKLEHMGIIEVSRSSGERSLYSFGPVPTTGTGTELTPVPTKNGTSPKRAWDQSQPGAEPVPRVGPEADRSRSEAVFKRESAGAREPVSKTYSLPPEPTEAYLQEADMYPVSREQATSTWKWFAGKGLPAEGLERPHMWLLQQAKERANRLAGASLASKRSAAFGQAPRQPDAGKTGWERAKT